MSWRAVDLLPGAIAIAVATAGCERQTEITVTSNTSATNDMSLLELARFELDSSEFKACRLDNLKPLDQVWTLTPEQQKIYAELSEGLTPNELSERAIDYAEDLDIEIAAHDRESIVMHLFRTAAEKQDAVAMSEIGASLLFCYNHVQQDLPRAKHFLERASELGDSYAMRSLASMHLSNLTEDENAAELGSELLERCQSLGNAQCGAAPGKIQKKNSKGP